VADIFTADDFVGLLRDHPDVHRAHTKLWLSDTAVLERVLHAASFGFADLSRSEIEDKLKVYVQNDSFPAAQQQLDARRVLIIAGAPGVGKTTLAEKLAWTYAGDGWELHPIDSVDSGLKALPGGRKVLLFDDFLGEIELDAPPNKDSKLTKLIRAVAKNPDRRFILTTRSYVLEAARQRSEHLSDPALDLVRYVLDVGVYTRRVWAHILYNHLNAGGLPSPLIEALVSDTRLPMIIDHPNYSPRIIAWMTDPLQLGEVAAAAYVDTFLALLQNPGRMWRTAYRTRIGPHCRHLLIAVYFSFGRNVAIPVLRRGFAALHPKLCAKYGLSHGPQDFEAALKILEGGFLTITNGRVTFLNPSVRDFLKGELEDPALLGACAEASTSAAWAAEVWNQARGAKLAPDELTSLASQLAPAAQLLATRRTLVLSNGAIQEADISIGARLELLVAWWTQCNRPEFTAALQALAEAPPGGFRDVDADAMLDLIVQIRAGDLEGLPQGIDDALEAGLAQAFAYMNADELCRVAESLAESSGYLGPAAQDALTDAIRGEFANLDEVMKDIGGDEDALEDHRAALCELGRIAKLPDLTVDRAMRAIDERISNLEDYPTSHGGTPAARGLQGEPFSNDDLRSLFASLTDDARASSED